MRVGIVAWGKSLHFPVFLLQITPLKFCDDIVVLLSASQFPCVFIFGELRAKGFFTDCKKKSPPDGGWQ